MREWSYTSTPPMGRTACTEPQCLYKGALYLTFIHERNLSFRVRLHGVVFRQRYLSSVLYRYRTIPLVSVCTDLTPSVCDLSWFGLLADEVLYR
jgi:hypothetical protein